MAGRKQLAVCKLLGRTDRLLVLELYEAVSMPYNFDVVLEDERLQCEFKSLLGLRLHALIIPRKTETDQPADDPSDLTATTAVWTGQVRRNSRD